MKKVETFILRINILAADWWTKEVRNLFCSICSKQGIKDCEIVCQINNPWCG